MPDTAHRPAGKPLSKAALLALLLGLAAVAVLLSTGLDYRLGRLSLPAALKIAEWAVYGAGLGLLLALAGWRLARPGSGRRGRWMAALGLVASLPVLIGAAQWKYGELNYPPINDISTDLEDPPVFWDMPNPTDYPGGETATLQRAAYPDIAPLTLAVPPARAHELALALARESCWEVVADQPAEGRIEAVASSLLFGFKDEVAIRITPFDGGSRVDLRSRSRLGRIDRGVNAKRIRAFETTLRKRAGE